MDEEPQDISPAEEPSPEDKRDEIAAGHDEAMDSLLPEPSGDADAVDHDSVLSEMAGAMDAPRTTMLDEARSIPTEDLGDEPEREEPTKRDAVAEHAAVMNAMADGQNRAAFGEDVNRFNAGEFAGGDSDFGGGGEEDQGSAIQQFTDADFENKSIVAEMLVDHSRRVEDLNRTLELERL
jgi:hypothetical protein